jgi:RHS repeat-associated protein
VAGSTSYYAVPGARAVRTSAGLFYVLTDHLGSASVSLDGSGAVVAEMRYDAFGATRLSTGTMPGDRLYTGQIWAEVGLYYFNARWYSVALGRWTQPDSIVPEPGNPQSLNRFGFVLNNPLRYTDPTGHRECDEAGCNDVGNQWAPPNWREILQKFGVTFDNWDAKVLDKALYGIFRAVLEIGMRFSETLGGTAAEAFKGVYGNVTMEWCDNCVSGMGWADGDHHIFFDNMYSSTAGVSRVVTHEMGHIFDRMVCAANQGGTCTYIWAATGTARSDLKGRLGTCETCLGRTSHEGPEPGEYWGFADDWEVWQFGAQHNNGEIWADMFLGWTYNTWEDSDRGYARRDYMNAAMTNYLTTNFAGP